VFRLNQHRGAGNLRSQFLQFDKDRNGRVTSEEIFAGLCAIGVALSDDELQALTDQYDTDGDRLIDYHEFARAMEAHREVVYTVNSVMYSKALQGHEVSDEAAERAQCSLDPRDRLRVLVDNIQQRAYERTSSTGGNTLRDLFIAADVDRSGRLSGEEVSDCLHAIGLSISKDEVEALLAVVDEDEDGLDYNEFLLLVDGGEEDPFARAQVGINASQLESMVDATAAAPSEHTSMQPVRPGSTAYKVTLLDDASTHEMLGVMRDFTQKKLCALQAAFQAADRNQDGVLSPDEFSSLLSNLGYDHVLSRDELQGLIDAHLNDDGLVTYKEILGQLGHTDWDEDDEEMDEAMSEAVAKFNEVVYDELRTLKKAFSKFDRNGSKTIDLIEFVHLMDRYGMKVTEQMAYKLFGFVEAGEGGLEYVQFVKLLGASSHLRR